MKEKRGLRKPINIDPAEKSHTWKFRTRLKQSLEIKELVELSGFPDQATFFKNVMNERAMVVETLRILAEKHVEAGMELLSTPLGLYAVKQAYAKRQYALRRVETTGVKD